MVQQRKRVKGQRIIGWVLFYVGCWDQRKPHGEVTFEQRSGGGEGVIWAYVGRVLQVVGTARTEP